MSVMNMILRDIQIPVREATISGYMLDPDWLNKYGKDENPGLEWEVVVQTEEKAICEGTDDETIVDPRMSWGELSFPTMRRWLDLEGKTIHSDATNRDPSAQVAYSYFWTHEAILNSTLKFVKRAGNKFVIHWEGTCNPMLGEPYDKDVPFLIQTEAIFKEISIQASQSDTDATTLERLSKYLDPADFIQHPMKETVRVDPVENRFGIIDPLLRWVFGCPSTRRVVFRSSVFEPRV
jgi:hypothetical protein